MSVAEIKQELSQLTKAERLELMEAIWDSFDHKDDEIPSPDWHGLDFQIPQCSIMPWQIN